MQDFLQISKQRAQRKGQRVHVVLCNEACDLDSTACALLYGYYLHLEHLQQVSTTSTNQTSSLPSGSSSDVIYLPVLNILRDDYSLRTDVCHVLEKHSITSDLLTFRNEISLADKAAAGQLTLTLVDFNWFGSGQDSVLESAVVEVIDHRVSERLGQAATRLRRCQIEMVGSCSTLVADILLNSRVTIDSSLLDILYSAVLVDTVCLNEAAGRTTAKDVNIVSRLEAIGVSRQPGVAEEVDGITRRQQLYNELCTIKQDVSSLSTRDLLRKDLKIINVIRESERATAHNGKSCTNRSSQRLAFSSIMLDIMEFLSRKDVIADIEKFCAEVGAVAEVLMFMRMGQSQEPSRQLAIYSKSDVLRVQLSDLLEKCKEPALKLSRVYPSASADKLLIAYRQGNIAASRKVVMPVISAGFRDNTQTSKSINQ